MTTTITWRTDEPPEINGRYLIYIRWADRVELGNYGGKSNGEMWFRGETDHRMSFGSVEVTAWAHLPEAPPVQNWRDDNQVAKEQSS